MKKDTYFKNWVYEIERSFVDQASKYNPTIYGIVTKKALLNKNSNVTEFYSDQQRTDAAIKI